jgi:outer membrane receptor protein involved in Fe transport
MKTSFLATILCLVPTLLAAQSNARSSGEGARDTLTEVTSVDIDRVVVRAKGRAQQLREGALAASAMQVAGALRNTPAGLNSIVGRATSVKIREEGGVGSDFDLSINGLSGNSVRYFLDGAPLESLGSAITLANIPTNIVERVEIFKGVVPAWLGADALGGAINIVTRKERRGYLDASYSTGSFHTHRAALNAQIVEPRTGLVFRPTVAVDYSKNDYVMKGVEVWDEASRKYIPVDRRRFHDDYFSALTQLEAGVQERSWADAFFLSASWSKNDKELQTGSVQSKVYGMARRRAEAWNVAARYSKRDFLAENLSLAASFSHTRDHSATVDTVFRKYDWNGEYIESSRNEITGRARSLRHYGRPTTILRASLEYRFGESHLIDANYLLNRTGNERWDEVDADFEPSNDVMTKHIAGLSYNQHLIDGRMDNTFFVKQYINRLDIRQTDLPSITGSGVAGGSTTRGFLGYGAGSRFTIAEPFSVKASFERSVRLPLARELLGNGTTVYANVALKPESSNNFNLGAFGTWRPAPGHTVWYEANAFLRRAENYIQATVVEKEGLMQYENVPAVHIKGVEGEVRYDWMNRLWLAAGASWQDARDQNRYKTDGKPSATYLNRVPNQPWLFGNVEAAYTLRDVASGGDILRLGCSCQWVHWYFLTWEAYGASESKARIPSQNILNADVTYSWREGRYNLSLECANLLDVTAYDNYKLQKPGRAFSLKFRLFIN